MGKRNRAAVTRGGSDPLGGGRSCLAAAFLGSMQSVVKAARAKASATVQPFFVLHLDIGQDGIGSVEAALEALVQPEKLEGARRWMPVVFCLSVCALLCLCMPCGGLRGHQDRIPAPCASPALSSSFYIQHLFVPRRLQARRPGGPL